jgi:hypothetical protein
MAKKEDLGTLQALWQSGGWLVFGGQSGDLADAPEFAVPSAPDGNP